MSDRVIVPVAGLGVLALDRETFATALAEGAKLIAAPASSTSVTNEPLLDADQLADLLKVPATWIEQKAREGIIPSLEFGRWRRFRRSEVEASVRACRSN